MLKKIRSLTDQYAISATFIVFILLEFLLLGIGKLLSLLPVTLEMRYLSETVLIIIPVAIVFFFGFSRAFRPRGFLRALICGLPYIVLQIIALVKFFAENLGNPEITWYPWYVIVLGIYSIVGVGIREECIYRATLQNLVAKKYANSVKGIWITALIGAAIFGLTHVSNLFFGMEPLAIFAQVISAACTGLLFGAIYLRSGNLWAPILIHTLTDITGLAQSTFLGGISDIEEASRYTFSWSWLIIRLSYIGFSAFLLRPSKCKQICERLCFAKKESESSTRT